MIDPDSGFNEVKIQAWGDAFWLKTRPIWFPFMALYKLIFKK